MACDGFCQTRSRPANAGWAKEGQGIGRVLAVPSNSLAVPSNAWRSDLQRSRACAARAGGGDEEVGALGFEAEGGFGVGEGARGGRQDREGGLAPEPAAPSD